MTTADLGSPLKKTAVRTYILGRLHVFPVQGCGVVPAKGCTGILCILVLAVPLLSIGMQWLT